jgi:hypothetical protein
MIDIVNNCSLLGMFFSSVSLISALTVLAGQPKKSVLSLTIVSIYMYKFTYMYHLIKNSIYLMKK